MNPSTWTIIPDRRGSFSGGNSLKKEQSIATLRHHAVHFFSAWQYLPALCSFVGNLFSVKQTGTKWLVDKTCKNSSPDRRGSFSFENPQKKKQNIATLRTYWDKIKSCENKYCSGNCKHWVPQRCPTGREQRHPPGGHVAFTALWGQSHVNL